mmetsp:Transcript_15321/g.13046  ORF Transcript_15321/g.13046 Transcript_15321/m.13046 type:complete len:95 (+) Transcript_15321:61-345(+)
MGNCETCQGCEGRMAELQEGNVESYSFLKSSTLSEDITAHARTKASPTGNLHGDDAEMEEYDEGALESDPNAQVNGANALSDSEIPGEKMTSGR